MIDTSSQQETAQYIFELLKSLEKISEAKELPVLARLIGAAKEEARMHT